MPRFLVAASCALCVSVISASDAQAQAQYPTRSIRFIVPVTTGGPSDIVARLLGDKLAAQLGKPVIVDNRPGASNTVGAALVAKAEPDGHTLLMAAGAPHIRAGALRALAVTTRERNHSFPDVPTMSEAGVSGYDFASWGGVFVPAGTPRAVVQKLNAAIVEALASPDIKKRFDDIGLEAKSSTPDAFGKFLQTETTRWTALLAKK